MVKVQTQKIYKKAEFREFLKAIKNPTVKAHWLQIAEALGVSKDTITVWKNHPEAIEAMRTGVDEAMEGMRKAGGKDWRMWESKLKMLKVRGVDKSEVTGKDDGPIAVSWVKPDKPDDEVKK